MDSLSSIARLSLLSSLSNISLSHTKNDPPSGCLTRSQRRTCDSLPSQDLSLLLPPCSSPPAAKRFKLIQTSARNSADDDLRRTLGLGKKIRPAKRHGAGHAAHVSAPTEFLRPRRPNSSVLTGSLRTKRRCTACAPSGHSEVDDVIPWTAIPVQKTTPKKQRTSTGTRISAHSVLHNPPPPSSQSAAAQDSILEQPHLQLEAEVFQLCQLGAGARCSSSAHLVEGGWVGLADSSEGWSKQGINCGLLCQELMWNCGEALRGSGFSDIEDEAVDREESAQKRADETLEGSCNGGALGTWPVHLEATSTMQVHEKDILGLGLLAGAGAIPPSAELRARRLQRRHDQHPRDVLLDAELRTELQGSCTAVLAALQGHNLCISTLGGSCFAVVRRGEIIGQSLPHPLADSMDAAGTDPSTRIMDYMVPVSKGDALVLGTREVFQSLSSGELAEIASEAEQEHCCAEVLAKRLALAALKKLQGPESDQTLTEAAAKQGRQHSGNKGDSDITTLVALVK